MIALLGALWILVGLARADEPWDGKPIATVSVQAPLGGIPEESLEPLLRLGQGRAVNASDIRLDLATLMRVGEFSAVEADVTDWFVIGEDGSPQPAVNVTYFVYPAPRAERLVVQGNTRFRDRLLRDAAAITLGQAFFEDLDGPVAAERVRRFLSEHGFPRAVVEIDPVPLAENQVEIWIRVSEGEPDVVTALEFVGNLPPRASEAQIRRWARQEGIAVGRPMVPEAVSAATYRIRQELASVGGWFVPHRGYLSARVTPAVVRDGTEIGVTWTIEPGPRLVLDVEGMPGLATHQKVREALGIDERLRLTRGFVEGAPERLEEWLQRRGFREAKASVRLETVPDEQRLFVDIETGPIFTVGRLTFRHPDGHETRLWRKGGFESRKVLADRRMLTVMEQASPLVLRYGYATAPELDRSADAASSFLEAQGHQEASVAIAEVRTLDDGWRFHLPAVLRSIGRPRPQRLEVVVDVAPGPTTVTGTVTLAGSAPGVPTDDLIADAKALEGRPFSPQALELLRRVLVERHRAEGWLDAEAALERIPENEQRIGATLTVNPGSRVLLRSIVTRGPRVTRPSFIRREVGLSIGKPLTSTDLDRVRRSLYDLDVFRSVSLALLGDEDQRDLVIDVVERPVLAFEAGVGVNTDQGVRSFGRIVRRNLFGVGHTLELYGILGLVYRQVARPDWRLSLSYTAPRFPFRNQRTSLSILARELVQERTWTMSRSGVILGINTQWKKVSLRLAAQIEARQLSLVDTGAVLPGEPWYALVQAGLPTAHRLQETLEGALVVDLRDDPTSPTRGFLASALTELAPGSIRIPTIFPAEPASYVKGEGRLSGYVPVGGLTLRLSGEGAYAYALGSAELPLEERYRLGGTGSMRGFERDAVGPRNRASRVGIWPDALAPILDYSLRTDPDRWAPTGGDLRAVGTAELIAPLPTLGLASWQGYAGALFVDVGNVWMVRPRTRAVLETSELVSALPVLRASAGVGARVSTPIGPLAIDVAANPAAMFAQGDLASILQDQYREAPLRVHLTLGSLW